MEGFTEDALEGFVTDDLDKKGSTDDLAQEGFDMEGSKDDAPEGSDMLGFTQEGFDTDDDLAQEGFDGVALWRGAFGYDFSPVSNESF